MYLQFFSPVLQLLIAFINIIINLEKKILIQIQYKLNNTYHIDNISLMTQGIVPAFLLRPKRLD